VATTTSRRRDDTPWLHYGPWLLFALIVGSVGIAIDPWVGVGLGLVELLTGAGYGLLCRVGRGGAEIRDRLFVPRTMLKDEALIDVVEDLLWAVRHVEDDVLAEGDHEKLMALYQDSVSFTAANPEYRPVHEATASLVLAHLVRQREASRPGPRGESPEAWRTVCEEIGEELRQIAAALPEGDAIRRGVERGLPASAAAVTAPDANLLAA
jgi:hypothetical protein